MSYINNSNIKIYITIIYYYILYMYYRMIYNSCLKCVLQRVIISIERSYIKMESIYNKVDKRRRETQKLYKQRYI